MRHLHRIAVLSVLALLAACGSDTTFPYQLYDVTPVDTGDASADPDPDATEDVSEDSTEDAGDAGEDTEPGDTTTDTGEDTTTDTGEDATSDAGEDTAEDVQPDGPAAGALGADCARNSECDSTICIPVETGRNVCTQPCADGCPDGWSCDEDTSICDCQASIEICNGLDDDCDAIVDEGTATALGCADFEVCNAGACTCPGGAITCPSAPDTCVDPLRDPNNCGECGTVCEDGTQCVSGDCICPDDYDTCDGTCTDTDTDPDNCGECGIACPDGLTCSAGECNCPGVDGRLCFGECTDVAEDPDNCGGCGIRCRVTEVCSDSACDCPDDWDRCDGLCLDTTDDPDNCGGCGIACGDDEVCADSTCVCGPGFGLCDGECIDTDTDRENCGGCGIVCEDDQACVAGSCGCPCPGDACELGTCLRIDLDESETLDVTFVTDPQQADIVFNMDTTGSMGAEIDNLQAALSSTVIPAARGAFANVGFAVTSYEDFPCDAHGSDGDRPFTLFQRVTISVSAAQAAVDRLRASGGGDTPESGFEALFQIATGVGRAIACIGAPAIEPFDPDANYLPNVADGTIGGVGFRDGSIPVIVTITDIGSHAYDIVSYPYGASRTATYAALQAIGARTVGLAGGTDAREFLTEVATETGSLVPTCAWNEGGRPAGCATTACCTGLSGGGRAAVDGLCPLVYDMTSTGTGLGTSIVDAIRIVGRFASFDVRVRVRGDAEILRTRGIDTACVVDGTRATGAAPLDCGFPTALEDTNDDSVPDTISGVTADVEVGFRLEFDNGCLASPGVYPVHFDVVAGEAAVFDTITVYVVVPE